MARPRARTYTFGPQSLAEDGSPTPLTRDEVAERVLDLVRHAQDERTEWMEQRIARYAKMRGWLEDRTTPWSDASNQHIPVMMANVLRTEAGLFNATFGMRPMFRGTPMRHEQKEAAELIDALLDHQMMVENPGEQIVEQFINRFTEDGTAIAFCPYVKTTAPVVDTRIVAKPDEVDARVDLAMAQALPSFLPQHAALTMRDDAGYHWEATLPAPRPEDEPTVVDIRVYDKNDRAWEVCLTWDATMFDGPTMLTQALEDIVVPMRCENTQPVSAQNPTGAPWVAHLAKVSVDTIRQRIRDKVYDQLTEEDLDEVVAVAEGRVPTDVSLSTEQGLKDAKDAAEGRSAGWQGPDDQITVCTWYGTWEVNGTLQEMLFTVLREPKRLARVRYLSEQYPFQPLRRPFAEARFIPVADQFYGIGLPELMEGMHNFLHIIINQMIDNGTLTNLPFGFYRASSGMKPEPIQIPGPGEMLPLDNPQSDVVFPVLPHADQSFGFNMVGLGMQFLERLVSMGPMQFGQVQQGKASALRTVGTTMAILQQGAAMPEQILRRLFFGLRQAWEQFHLLNTRFLPPGKRFLITGKPTDQPGAYGHIADPQKIAIPLAFDFQATLLNTNKGMVSQALQALGAALFNPLAMQFGTVDGERFYNWQRDLVQAQQLDPARYLKKPALMPAGDGPRLTAHEVILWIAERMQVPPVNPMEPPDQHLQALMGLIQQPENQSLLGGEGGLLVREYLRALTALIQQQQQAMMMQQAAQQFSQSMGQEGGGQGGQPGQVPEMQAEAPTQQEIQGAGTQGPPGSAGG